MNCEKETNPKENLLLLKSNRRGFLKFVRNIGLGYAGMKLAEEGTNFIEDAREIADTWTRAAVANDEFFQKYSQQLKSLTLGISFAPEEFSDDERQKSIALSTLKIIIEDLYVKDIRLGIRWNRALDENGNIDLHFYDPYLRYCLDQGARVCLNIGPIRVFRWKEDHVPKVVTENLEKVPKRGSKVIKGEELADIALDYTENLLKHLTSHYSQKQLTQITAVQPENEGFYAFGENGWTVGPKYIKTLIIKTDKYFPNAKILLNSAGRRNLDEITSIFLEMMTQDSHRFKNRFISGFDYYYKTPKSTASFPAGEIIEFFKNRLDPIASAGPFIYTKSCSQQILDARRNNFSIEVTEGQAEPYPPHYSPGNDAQEFRFMLLRCMEKVLDLGKEPSVLRIWGMENLARKVIRRQLTTQHQWIIEMIKEINITSAQKGLA